MSTVQVCTVCHRQHATGFQGWCKYVRLVPIATFFLVTCLLQLAAAIIDVLNVLLSETLPLILCTTPPRMNSLPYPILLHYHVYFMIMPKLYTVTFQPLPDRKENGDLIFKDHPEFVPNMTPKEVLQAGSFGGTYYRDIYSSVLGERRLQCTETGL